MSDPWCSGILVSLLLLLRGSTAFCVMPFLFTPQAHKWCFRSSRVFLRCSKSTLAWTITLVWRVVAWANYNLLRHSITSLNSCIMESSVSLTHATTDTSLLGLELTVRLQTWGVNKQESSSSIADNASSSVLGCFCLMLNEIWGLSSCPKWCVRG